MTTGVTRVANEDQKGEKKSFSPIEFARETKNEIKKVTWPTRKETVTMTFMIVLMALIAGAFFLAVDSGLGYVISHILGMNS